MTGMILETIPPQRCSAKSQRSGTQCRKWAIRGGRVCDMHGGRAPQVREAAARRVSLAEAVAGQERRHPVEVMDSALHVVDVAGRQLLERLSTGGEITAEDITSLIETAKTQAAMARAVLDTHRGDWTAWSKREAIRQQADALAQVVREVAQILGHDPDSAQVQDAMEQGVARVVHGRIRATVTREIEGQVVHDA